MNATKGTKKRYVMSAIRSQYADAVGGESVEVEGPGGMVLSIAHPMFADKAWKKAVIEAEATGEDEAMARAVLGEEQYEAFSKAGGDDVEVVLLMAEVAKDTQATLANGRPTR